MSANYEWQNQQVKERLEGHRREAAEHRLARSGHKTKAYSSRRNLAVRILIAAGLLIVAFQLSSCSPVDVALEPAGQAAAEGISEITLGSEVEAKSAAGAPAGLTIAERISFQDRIAESSVWTIAAQAEVGAPLMTMADRIRFHDRLSK